jgi:hypothetical protein
MLSATVRRIASLKPPAGTESRFRRYTRANAVLLARLTRFVDALASGGPTQQRSAGVDAQAAVDAANRAQTDLQHALG